MMEDDEKSMTLIYFNRLLALPQESKHVLHFHVCLLWLVKKT